MSEAMPPLASELFALLDLIEQEQDYTLANQRFAIAENHGLVVEFTGQDASGEKN